MTAKQRPFRIRTITAFITLQPDDFIGVEGGGGVAKKIEQCNSILRKLETKLIEIGYEVQTVRIGTNPFGEWLMNSSDNHIDEAEQSTNKHNTENMNNTMDVVQKKLHLIDQLLSEYNIDFCSLGPSMDVQYTISICPMIVNTSKRLSCSANVNAGDVNSAQAAARCILTISTLDKDNNHPNDAKNNSFDHVKGGLGNFRFCASSCVTTVPFFPAAKTPSITNSGENSSDTISFAIGLENGKFARQLLEEAQSIGNIKHIFDTKMRLELLLIQEVCTTFASIHNCKGDGAPSTPSSSSTTTTTTTRRIPTNNIVKYLGIDTSLNPSLDIDGSIASAIECLTEVSTFGRAGTLAAAAAITMSLQSLPDIVTTGYCGLMLPVLEDRRLAELGMIGMDGTSSSSYPTNDDHHRLTIDKLLCISSVCGVGVDTVPVPGNVSQDNLTSLILDVAALAGRWNKALSVRVFPVPGVNAGEMTTFDSPYMCNSRIFNL
jgi:uncharacterized protein (UPF0210 family)